MANAIQIILLIFIAWFIVTQKSEGMAALFGKQRRIILDSCALIDGRVVELTNSGFVSDELVIPQFILNELQLLADGNDSHKRERARFGLDIAHQLQDTAPNRVTIDRSVFPEVQAIDDKLLLLARKLKAQLYTTDYNLSKVAAVEGVRVLNVNELAQNLRPITLPGETLKIKIIQRGSSRDQGVGYLDDGTMIVVDNAARYVNKIVPVTVTRMHQTVAGKMVFGQVQTERQQSPTNGGGKPASDEVAALRAAMVSSKPKPSTTSNVSSSTPVGTDSRRSSSSHTPHESSDHGKLHNRLKSLRRRPNIQ
ncbi:MAG: TRAM domain-containing protein [Candidatus Saccharimonadales bacterium]